MIILNHNLNATYEIWGYHGGEYDDAVIMRCNAV